jgi:hypothetical protein
LNLFFTTIFTIELAINALAHWFWPFATDVWSQVDVFVVVMSIVPLLVPAQNTGIVRILRAFRILRLFRRVPSLRKIITALTMALLPVLNVFCILFLLMGICKRNVGTKLIHFDKPHECSPYFPNDCSPYDFTLLFGPLTFLFRDLQGRLWLYPCLVKTLQFILRWPCGINIVNVSVA